MTSTENVFVNKLENITKKLINDDLGGFFPHGSKVILADENEITVPGHNTSVSFAYWTTDPAGQLSMSSNDTVFNKLIGNQDTPEDRLMYPSSGCPPHSYRLNSKSSSNWFLFISSHSILEKEFTFKALNDGAIEIVSEGSADFRITLNEDPSVTPLGDWINCFSAELVWQTTHQWSAPFTLVPCQGSLIPCYYSQIGQSFPSFPGPGTINLTVKLIDQNNATWEGKPKSFEIKFKTGYDFSQPAIHKLEHIPGAQDIIFSKELRFTNVLSQPEILLISNRNTLDDLKCPPATIPSSSHQIRQLPINLSCNLQNLVESSGVCITSDFNSLAFTVTISAYQHVIKGNLSCEYDSLYLYWPPTPSNVVETAWFCEYLDQDVACNPELNKSEFLKSVGVP